MGFLQFHQQPQPRKIIQTPKMILIEYEANYGLRHIYIDGRKLPAQGEPQPWWYGYSVGHWEGDTLVVETNNLRGAEEGPYDGWLDVNGSPYSGEAKFIERFRRPTYDHLQIDVTLEDPKAYTKPWTVRIDQRFLADEEPDRIRLQREPAVPPAHQDRLGASLHDRRGPWSFVPGPWSVPSPWSVVRPPGPRTNPEPRRPKDQEP